MAAMQQLFLSYFYVFIQVAVAVALLHASYSFPGKYVRVTNEGCHSSWVAINSTNGTAPICCTGGGYFSWNGMTGAPCYPHMEKTRLFTSALGAWLIPLVGPILTVLVSQYGVSKRKPSSRSSIFALRRTGLYFFLMVLRVAVLYVALNEFQELIFPHNKEEETCWYLPLRKSRTCGTYFDYADHVILFMVHFVCPTVFELLAAAVEIGFQRRFLICAAWSGAVLSCTLYFLYNTALSFHSSMETFVAWLLATVTIVLPLYLIISNSLPFPFLTFRYFAGGRVSSAHEDRML